MIRIGKPAPAEADAVDALLACHERIREFVALAQRLARASGLDPAEARAAAAAVHRYFATALPLHAEDEERSILPRLRGREAALDGALEAMQREHAEHGAPLARLLAACEAVRGDPARLVEVAPALGAAGDELARHFEAHLAAEERVVFPALRRLLAPAEQASIRAEMRARRDPAT